VLCFGGFRWVSGSGRVMGIVFSSVAPLVYVILSVAHAALCISIVTVVFGFVQVAVSLSGFCSIAIGVWCRWGCWVVCWLCCSCGIRW
jgi:hypothetical protein